jgi:hypothetical protein
LSREKFWTPEMMLYAGFLYKRRNGKFPNTSAWLAAGDDNPSWRTVLNEYGTWDVYINALHDYEASLCVVTS